MARSLSGTGAIVIHNKLDAGRFELPKPICVGEQQVMVSDAFFEVIESCMRERGTEVESLRSTIVELTHENQLLRAAPVRQRDRAYPDE